MSGVGRSMQYYSGDRRMRLVCSLTDNALPDSRFETHTHIGECEIYYFAQGELFFAFEGDRYRVEPGTLIIVSDGTLHRPVITGRCTYSRRRILFARELLTQTVTGGECVYRQLSDAGIILLSPKQTAILGAEDTIRRIEEHLSRGEPSEDFRATVLLYGLIVGCVDADCDPILRVEGGRAKQIVEYIDTHLGEDLSYRAIAEAFFISEKSLYKFFKGETGFTLSSYVSQRRVMRACELLAGGYTAEAASATVGYRDYSAFYRVFIKIMGRSPSEYASSIRDRKQTGGQK